jgi:hypothetical protein
VDFTDWRMEPVAMYASLGVDTLYVLTGAVDSMIVSLRNWATPEDLVDVSAFDERGWLDGTSNYALALDDSVGGGVNLSFTVPAGAAEGTRDKITVTAVSQADPLVAATDSLVIVAVSAILSEISIAPDEVEVPVGGSLQFAAEALDQFGDPINVTFLWTAVGGTIDSNGLFTAGDSEGDFEVSVSDVGSQLQATAIVHIVPDTATEDTTGGLPDAYDLLQNYPNPFNPSTKIRFDLPEQAHVRLQVFDMLGRRVQIMVDADMMPGHHEIAFESRTLPSGIYFYVLQAGDFSASKKMVRIQ